MSSELEAWYRKCCNQNQYKLDMSGYKESVDNYYKACKSSKRETPEIDDPLKAYLRLPAK